MKAGHQDNLVSRGQDLPQNSPLSASIEPATLRLPQVVCPIGCFSWLALCIFQPTSTAESSTRLSYRGTNFVATLKLYNCHPTGNLDKNLFRLLIPYQFQYNCSAGDSRRQLRFSRVFLVLQIFELENQRHHSSQ
jgi:hypothetical protein